MGVLKLKVVWFLILSLVTVLLAGCQNDKPIVVGLVGSMNSDLSISGSQGAEMAVYRFNKSGGINGHFVELRIKDDEGKPEMALKRDEEFVSEGIKLIIGNYTSGLVTRTIEYVNSQDILLVSPTASADTLSGKDDNFIRFIASAKDEAVTLADAADKLGDKRFAVIYDDSNVGFANELAAEFKAEMTEKTGVEPLVIAYDPNKPEQRETAFERVREANPEAVLMIVSSDESLEMMKKLHVVAPHVRLYNSMWANTQAFLKDGIKEFDGMVVVAGIDLQDESEPFSAFKANYIDSYHEEPDYAAMYSYEATMAVLEAIRDSGSEDPAMVKKQLIEKSKFEGLQGEISINSFGDATRAYNAYVINDGKLEKIQ